MNLTPMMNWLSVLFAKPQTIIAGCVKRNKILMYRLKLMRSNNKFS